MSDESQSRPVLQSVRGRDRLRLRRRQIRGTPTITPGQGWSRRPHNVSCSPVRSRTTHTPSSETFSSPHFSWAQPRPALLHDGYATSLLSRVVHSGVGTQRRGNA